MTSFVRLWRKKVEDFEENLVLSLAKKLLDPDPHQHEKWEPDTDPHQNVLDPPHCLKVSELTFGAV